MRSLILLDVKFTQLVSSTLGAVVAGIATDPSTDSLYAIAENSGPDGTTELSVFVVNDEQASEVPRGGGAGANSVARSCLSRLLSGLPKLCRPCRIPTAAPSSRSNIFLRAIRCVSCWRTEISSRSLSQGAEKAWRRGWAGSEEELGGGTGADGCASLQRENVGSVDAGIKSAAWSPDEELLVLITGACRSLG